MAHIDYSRIMAIIWHWKIEERNAIGLPCVLNCRVLMGAVVPPVVTSIGSVVVLYLPYEVVDSGKSVVVLSGVDVLVLS